MRIKVNFKPSDEVITHHLNKKVNGFINSVLGAGNKYHGNFSRYSISPMLGYVVDKKSNSWSYPKGGHIFISSDDPEFMETVANSLCGLTEPLKVGSMELDMDNMFSIEDFCIEKKYDIVRTTGPVIVKDGIRALTFKDDGFLDVLRKKSILKLIHNGIAEDRANTIKMSLFHPENSRVETWEIGSQKNIVSRIMLIVRGDREARLKLYELGLGVSTGFGFGSVSLRNNINNK